MGRKNLPEKQKRKLGLKGNPKYVKMKSHKFLEACKNIVEECKPKKRKH